MPDRNLEEIVENQEAKEVELIEKAKRKRFLGYSSLIALGTGLLEEYLFQKSWFLSSLFSKESAFNPHLRIFLHSISLGLLGFLGFNMLGVYKTNNLKNIGGILKYGIKAGWCSLKNFLDEDDKDDILILKGLTQEGLLEYPGRVTAEAAIALYKGDLGSLIHDGERICRLSVRQGYRPPLSRRLVDHAAYFLYKLSKLITRTDWKDLFEESLHKLAQGNSRKALSCLKKAIQLCEKEKDKVPILCQGGNIYYNRREDNPSNEWFKEALKTAKETGLFLQINENRREKQTKNSVYVLDSLGRLFVLKTAIDKNRVWREFKLGQATYEILGWPYVPMPVTVLDYEGNPYYVMRRSEGYSLDQLVRSSEGRAILKREEWLKKTLEILAMFQLGCTQKETVFLEHGGYLRGYEEEKAKEVRKIREALSGIGLTDKEADGFLRDYLPLLQAFEGKRSLVTHRDFHPGNVLYFEKPCIIDIERMSYFIPSFDAITLLEHPDMRVIDEKEKMDALRAYFNLRASNGSANEEELAREHAFARVLSHISWFAVTSIAMTSGKDRFGSKELLKERRLYHLGRVLEALGGEYILSSGIRSVENLKVRLGSLESSVSY